MYKYNLRFFALLLVLLASGCANRLPTPPIKVPVSLNKAGTIIDMDFKVKRAYQYGFALVFVYNKNGKDERYSLERDKLRKLMGSSELDKNGNPINVGVPIPVRLKVTSISDNKVIYQTTIVPHLGSWGSGSFNKWLGSKKLDQGNYNVVVENITNITEFNNTAVCFLISEKWYK